MWQERGPNLDSSLLPNGLGGKLEREKEKKEKGRDLRERGSTFSLKFSDDQTVGSRRAKRQSCSTLQGLCVGTGFEEFRQLREVGVFSYFDIPCLKGHDNGFGYV